MNVEPNKTYVVAVSGGVDSMVLLDMLANQANNNRLIVAHFDHGIRSDSDQDRRVVQAAAKRYGLPFEYEQAFLGAGTSEDTARKARYDFLHRVKAAHQAHAIITAHHQDDLLETAILNILRGTGPRGLVSLRSRPGIERPLLHVSKKELIDYAEKHHLIWREDSTNSDTRYLRNYVRQAIVPKLSPAQRQELLDHISRVSPIRQELNELLAAYLDLHPDTSKLNRHWFIMLPHAVAREVMVVWLQRHQVTDITSKMLERLVQAAKTYAAGRQADVDKHWVLSVERATLALKPRDR